MAALTEQGRLFYSGQIPNDAYLGRRPIMAGSALEMNWNGKILWKVKHPGTMGIRLKTGNVMLMCYRLNRSAHRSNQAASSSWAEAPLDCAWGIFATQIAIKEYSPLRPPLRALPEGVMPWAAKSGPEPFHLKEIPDRLCKPGQPEPLGAIPAMPIQIIAVEVVRWGDWWDDRWAVAIRYSNGRRQVFQLGNRVQAEKEVDRLRREAIRSVSDS